MKKTYFDYHVGDGSDAVDAGTDHYGKLDYSRY